MGQEAGMEVDLHSDALRPSIKVGGFGVDFADHSKEVKVDEKEWEIYSNYITTLEEHKVWKAEEDKRLAEEARIQKEKDEAEIAAILAQIAEMQAAQAKEAEGGEGEK